MSHPRDHHFVPVFYLKRWARYDGKLVAYSRPYGKVFRKRAGPRAVGFERDLYSFSDLPPKIAQFLESVFLQRTDSMAAQVLERMTTTGTAQNWTSQTRSAWSRFLINFLIRHPDPFKEIRTAVYDRWRQPDDVTQAEYERLRGPEDPPTFQKWIDAQGGQLADRIRIRLIQGVMDNERLGNRVNSFVWDVLDTSKADYKLLTSDWPLDHTLGSSRAHIALPVGPTMLFVGAVNRDVLRAIRQRKMNEVVRTMNKLVVSRARRFVFSLDESQDEFVRKHMSTKMIPAPFYPSIAPRCGA